MHTQEKLRVDPRHPRYIETEDGEWQIATTTPDIGSPLSLEQRNENAARLVHCWNCHDQLVAACEAALDLPTDEPHPAWDLLRAVLAAAKGEKIPG